MTDTAQPRSDCRFYPQAERILWHLERHGFPTPFVTPSDEGGQSIYFGPSDLFFGSLWITIEPSEEDKTKPEIWVTLLAPDDRKLLDKSYTANRAELFFIFDLLLFLEKRGHKDGNKIVGFLCEREEKQCRN